MNYAGYLKLDQLLACQERASEAAGRPAHDEMLFIIVHQTYELWFKQILFELDAVEARLGLARIDERDMAAVVRALERVVLVFKTLVGQVDILESMTPLDFLDFRDLLTPASGFQSEQFRLIESRLGLTRAERLSYDGRDYDDRLPEAAQERLRAAEARASLASRLDRWLARTPFVAMGSYDFRSAYERALHEALAGERAILAAHPYLSEEEKAVQLAAIDRAAGMLDGVLDPVAYGRLREAGQWRLSREALQAALFIMLYRDEPALQLPFTLLSLLMDIDEMMTLWRHRHALMVQRMIGRKVGTGGSSGHDYLRGAAERHRVFGDLFALVTFLLPGSKRPALPAEVRDTMRFRYEGEA